MGAEVQKHGGTLERFGFTGLPVRQRVAGHDTGFGQGQVWEHVTLCAEEL